MPNLTHVLFAVSALAAPAVAQSQRILLGPSIVDVAAEGPVGVVAGAPGHARALWAAGSMFWIDGAAVDADQRLSLRPSGTELVLRRAPDIALWSVPLQPLGVDPARPQELRWLVGERAFLARSELVVLGTPAWSPDSGGIVALDAKDGAELWRAEGPICSHMLVWGQLVLGVGPVADRPRVAGGPCELVAWSVQNGARSMRAEVPAQPRGLAASGLGLAVYGRGWLRVFDPSGPLLFERDADVAALRAFDTEARQGLRSRWVALTSEGIVCWDRGGEELWSIDAPHIDDLAGRTLAVTPAGDVVLAEWHRIADSGVALAAYGGANGEPVWTRSVGGLEVPHSKYNHHVDLMMRGKHLAVVSHGSAGAFVELVEPGTGKAVHRMGGVRK